jgi:hypothetical protein
MSKVKMRCARCNKPFKSSDAKQTLCPDCAAKERLARAKGAASAPVTVAKPVHTPKIIGPGAGVVGASASTAHSAPPPDRGAFGAAARRAEQEERRAHDPRTQGDHRTHGDHRDHGQPTPPTQHHSGPGGREAQPAAFQGGAYGKQPGHGHAASGPQGAHMAAVATKPRQPRTPEVSRPLREARERKPPQPQELTPEQRTLVENRYLELAQPVEFDGIRGRISSDLGLPKPLVRKAILELRQRMGLPSWWELQGFPGTPSDLERVRAAYLPLLPVPPIGVHKRIAAELGLEPHAVYKGIRQIRGQLGLPQFNPPDQHPEYVQASANAGGAASADPAAVAPE